jgi:peptidoglycan/xylan/chitin deacetylase (PgdA/CDA1 family)
VSAWLDPLRRTLDAAQAPVMAFIRDDDAGWDDPGLFALLDLCDRYDAPIDLAVIPTELRPELADALMIRRADPFSRIGLHQHGYCHANHQTEGRKCEFGTARSRSAQYDDIAEGRYLLHEQLGDALDPFFTPPWNRCTDDTASVLVELGFAVLSRDATAAPFEIPELSEVVVQVDWFAHRNGERLTRNGLGSLIAERAAGTAPLGVMLHHAVMDEHERAGVAELLAVLTTHPNVAMRSMAQVAAARTPFEETTS